VRKLAVKRNGRKNISGYSGLLISIGPVIPQCGAHIEVLEQLFVFWVSNPEAIRLSCGCVFSNP
jgi:hypothetical protein